MQKKIFTVLGLFGCIALSCCNNTAKKNTDTPQNNNYLVTMEGIDSLKLGMTKTELEKLLNTQLTLPNLANDGGADTINVKYRNMEMTLFMDGSNDSSATVRAVQTTNPSCKTASGLGVGADKLKVIDTYPDNQKYVGPEYEVYPVRSVTKSVVAVMDTADTRAVVFHIIAKKVVSLEVVYYYEFY